MSDESLFVPRQNRHKTVFRSFLRQLTVQKSAQGPTSTLLGECRFPSQYIVVHQTPQDLISFFLGYKTPGLYQATAGRERANLPGGPAGRAQLSSQQPARSRHESICPSSSTIHAANGRDRGEASYVRIVTHVPSIENDARHVYMLRSFR